MGQIMDLDKNIKEIQKGLLKWYPFKKSSSCLYVGKETDAVFEMFCDKTDDFLIKGIQVECVRPEEIMTLKNPDDKYDYIIAIESLEILQDVESSIRILSGFVKQDGHILLGFNNRFGTRYFFGDKDPYTGNILDGIDDYRRAYSKKEDAFVGRCYDKQTLVDLFDTLGLKHQNYSVFPDLKNTQIILRDDYESNEDFSIRVLPTYNHADTVFLEEEYIYNSLQKNHMLHSMTNAFLFDCTFDGEGLDVLQITSSMGRAKEDSFFTLIHDYAAGTRTVEKLPAYREGLKKLDDMLGISQDLKAHGISVVDMSLGEIRNDTYKDHKENEKDREDKRDEQDERDEKPKSLCMPFIIAPTAQAYLKELVKQDEEEFVKKLDEFVELIKRSSGHVKEDLGDGTGIILEKGYPDLVPLNAFYVDGEFVFFDQEFSIPDYPVNMMLYRAVSVMNSVVNSYCEKYSMDDLYQRYGLKDKLQKWQQMEWEFIRKLRKEKEMAPYFSKVRYDGNKIYSNRLRMNFSAEEYLRKFVNLFNGLSQKKAVIFGTGNFAKQFMQMYGFDYDVAAVIDNRRDKHGEEFFGVKVSGPEILNSFESGSYRVIVCIKNFLSVMNQLEDMGIKDYGIFDPNQQYVRERRVTSSSGNIGAEASDESSETGISGVQKGSGPKKYHIGYIAGVFDLFHVGHLEKFKLAKQQFDHLIVGLVTDEAVRLYKKTEPFVPFEDRKAMLEACRYVDEVVKIPQNFGGTRDAWRMYGFDVQFSGSDYVDNPEWLAEKQFLEDHGVDMVFFPYTESTSSTKLKALISKKLI